MRSLILACAFLLCFASLAVAGSVNVVVGRGLGFGRVGVGVGLGHGVAVVRQPVFVQRQVFVPRVAVQRQFLAAPVYSQSFGLGYGSVGFAAPSYGVQTFAAPACPVGASFGYSSSFGFGY